MNIFNDYEKVYAIVESAYRKLKTYYYYDNTLLFMKKKIAEAEYNEEEFISLLNNIANILCYPKKRKTIYSINKWVDQIDFYALPKTFKTNKSSKDIVTNIIDQDSTLDKVNLYIDAPLELHILDLIWCMYIGKFAEEKNLFSIHSYAYKFYNYLFNDTSDLLDSFNLHSTWLFEKYYDRYSLWRDNAINYINNRYAYGKNSLMISLDIKSYYYAIRFEFNMLDDLLLNSQYGMISNLTKVIEKAYTKYSDIVSEYRKDVFLDTNELVLPIGFLSSGVISNLYLSDFDETIIGNLSPIYYGRYVDDILMVINPDKGFNMKYNINQIITETLVSKRILLEENDIYILSNHKELTIQKDKIRVFYIDSKAPKSILDMITKDIGKKSSLVNLLPDIDDSTVFNQSAYKYEKNDMVTKLRDLDILNKDKFNALKYITNQLWKNHNVIITKTKEFTSELKQICSFFSGYVALELYASWTKIFTYYLIIADKKHFQSFYNETKKSIKNLKASTIQDVNSKKKSAVLTRVKETLYLYLNIAEATASALDIKFLNTISDKLIKVLAIKLRKSNLFNHHYMSYPMINYTSISNNVKVSFLSQEIEYYSDFFKRSTQSSNTIFDEFLIKYSPRFIHLEEFFILSFIKKFHNEGWNDADINKKNVGYYFKLFGKSYKLESRPFISEEMLCNEQICKKRYSMNGYIFNNFSFSRNISGERFYYRVVKNKVKIAFANVKISELECINPVLGNGKSNSTYSKKMKLYNFLGLFLENKADIFIMPELYVPIAWLKELSVYSRKTQKVLIFGLEYIKNGNIAHNHIVTIIPSVNISGFKMASIFIREKNNYSPIEKIGLAKYGLTCNDQDNSTYNLFKWKGIDFTCFNCYEMTDIVARSLFKSQIDILFAVEYNKDTNYFSSIVESTSRDLHCFIVQSNTSQYGDSRITSPTKTESKDILKIKGGDVDSIQIGTINVRELNDFQSSYNIRLKKEIKEAKNASKKKKKKDPYKPLPANYVNRNKK